MTPDPEDTIAHSLAELQMQRQFADLQRTLEQRTEELRELSSHLMQMQDEERRNIARELHDSAGQIVVAIGMNLVSLQRTLQQAAERRSKRRKSRIGVDNGLTLVGDSIELVAQLSQEVRTISHLLHPPLLDEMGLRSALQWYVDGFTQRSAIAVELKLSADLGRLSRETETAIFRIVQESLTNVHRHSGSRTASIHIFRENVSVLIRIADIGTGMKDGKLRSGVGIQSMTERTRKLGGRLEIESGKQGTIITAVLAAEMQPREASSRQGPFLHGQ
jgi:signal transduction histidine kinase